MVAEGEEGAVEAEVVVQPLPSALGRTSQRPRIRCGLRTVPQKAQTAGSFQRRYPVRL